MYGAIIVAKLVANACRESGAHIQICKFARRVCVEVL